MRGRSWPWALAAAGLFAWVAPTWAAAERREDYALHGALTLSPEAPFQRVTLPFSVYLASRERNLADLRVFNEHGELVPFAFLEASPQVSSATTRIEVKPFPLRTNAAASGGGLHLVVRHDGAGVLVAVEEAPDAVAGAPVHGYLLDTGTASGVRSLLDVVLAPAVSGFHHIDVEASDDLVTWNQLLTGSTLAQFSYGTQQLRQQQLELPPTTARYLRINWREPARAADVASVFVQIDASRSVPPPRIWSAPMPLTRQATGEYDLRLDGALPADRLRLELADTNVLAPVSISGRHSDRQPWLSLTHAVVYRLAAQGREWTSPDLELPGTELKQLRVRVEGNGAALGAAMPSLRLGLRPRELVYLARGKGPFTLAVGQSGVPASALPIDSLVPGFSSGDAPPIAHASLKMEDAGTLRPAPQETSEASPPFPRKWVLWTVLVAAVLALSVMAFSLLRQSRKGEVPPNKD